MAAKYRKVDPRIWSDESFTKLDAECKLLAVYCLTSSQVNRIGLYRLSLGMAAEELGMVSDTVSHTVSDTMTARIRRVCETLNWEWDDAAKVLYLPTWWKYNAPDNAKHFSGCLSDLHDVPNSFLIARFAKNLKYLPAALHEGMAKGMAYRIGYGMPYQEQEQEQEQDLLNTPLAAGTSKDDQNKAKAIELAKSFRMPPGCDTPEHRGAMWRWLLSRYHKHGTWYHETAWEPFMMTRRHWTPEQWMLALTEAAAQSNEHPASYAVEKASKQGGPTVPPKSKTKELTAP